MLPALNETELALIASVRDGLGTDLSGTECPIRTRVLRYLLLQIPDPSLPDWMSAAGRMRWVLKGARFDERLDLRDARSRDGGPLPALIFDTCTFSNGFNGDGARFGSLRFSNCTFRYENCDAKDHAAPLTPINLRNARITGELRFKNLKPCGEHAFLWAYAKGTVVDASIRFHGVHFRAPKQEEARSDGSTRFGLDLEAARIAGHLRLNPDLRVEGGIRLQNARIDGNLWADGLQATDGEDAKSRAKLLEKGSALRFAIDAQTANICGVFVLRTYVNPDKERKLAALDGDAHFLGLQVAGGIFLDWLSVRHVPVEVASPVRNLQESAKDGRISEPLAPNMKECNIQMAHVVLGGPLSFESIWLPVEILRPYVSGVLALQGATVNNYVSIDADLNRLLLDGATVASDLTVRGTVSTIEAPRLTVGGDCTLASHVGDPFTVNLRRSTFHGSLDITLLRFEQSISRFFSAPPVLLHQLTLRGVNVDRTLAVVPYPPLFVSARKADLTCWPQYCMIEVQLAKSPDSDADRGSWRGQETAFVTLLCHKPTKTGHVIDGITIAPPQGALRSPLQQMVADALKSMDFANDEAVQDYLRLFCACLSAEETDFFSIAEKPTDLPSSLRKVKLSPLSVPQRSIVDGQPVSDTVGFMRGRGQISKFTFRLHSNGYVSLEGDEEPVLQEEVREERHYDRPFRYGADAERPDYSPLEAGDTLTRSELEDLLPSWNRLLFPQGRWAKTRVDLRDATCATLQDEGGSAWQGGKVLLENFTYTRLVSSKTALREVELRKQLLNYRPTDAYFELDAYHRSYQEGMPYLRALPEAQRDPSMPGMIQAAAEEMNSWFVRSPKPVFMTELPSARIRALLGKLEWQSDLLWISKRLESTARLQETFHPQPYTQLSRVLRDQGDEEGSREIEKEKIRSQLELNVGRSKAALQQYVGRGGSSWKVMQRWSMWTGLNAWSWLYGKGFGYGLDFVRAAVTLVICWSVGWGVVAAANHAGYLIANTSTVTSAIATTDAGLTPVFPKNAQPPFIEELPCRGNINQFLYAVESFTPLLNLRQESRCDLRPPHAKEHLSLAPRLLEMLKFVYELLGYVITSLAVLTFSGIARRWDQSQDAPLSLTARGLLVSSARCSVLREAYSARCASLVGGTEDRSESWRRIFHGVLSQFPLSSLLPDNGPDNRLALMHVNVFNGHLLLSLRLSGQLERLAVL